MPVQQPSEFDVVMAPTTRQQRKVDLVIVSSVALSFISFWRAAAIVLNDMASTVYYIGGISEQAIGKAAPVSNSMSSSCPDLLGLRGARSVSFCFGAGAARACCSHR